MIYHVWSRYQPKDPSDVRRHALAQASWVGQPWAEFPIDDTQLERPFKEGDCILPRVTELIDIACRDAEPDDVVLLTNADIGFSRDAGGSILDYMTRGDAGWSNRREFKPGSLKEPPTRAAMEQAPKNSGMDSFFFLVRWWKTFRQVYPDLVLAREAWDACLMQLIKVTVDRRPLDIECISWHEEHGGENHWMTRRYSFAGQLHNLRLAKQFLRRLSVKPEDYGIK